MMIPCRNLLKRCALPTKTHVLTWPPLNMQRAVNCRRLHLLSDTMFPALCCSTSVITCPVLQIVVPIDCLAHELDESDGEDEGCSKVADSLSFGMATPPPCSKERAAGLAQTLLLSKRAASRSIELTPPYGAGPVASRLARMTVACPSPADGAPCSPARPSPPAATSYVAVTPSPPSRSAVSKRFQGVLRMADLFAKVSDLGQDSARASPAPVRCVQSSLLTALLGQLSSLQNGEVSTASSPHVV